MKKTPRAKTVDAYIKAAPKEAQGMLRELRKAIKGAAPKAVEKINYGMPYYGYYGRLAYFGAFKNHCSFFWVKTSDKQKYKKELASYNLVGKTLRFPIGKPVRTALISKLVKARTKENELNKKIICSLK